MTVEKLNEIFNESKLLELLSLKMESDNIEYKEKILFNDTKSICELVKDIIGFLNTKSGYIILGVRDRDYKPVGLPAKFHIDVVDLNQKIGPYIQPYPETYYKEITLFISNQKLKFGFIYLEPDGQIYLTAKDGNYTNKKGKGDKVFRSGEIFIRKQGKTIRTDAYSLNKLLAVRKGIYKKSDKEEILELDFSNIDEIKSGKKQNIIRPNYSRFIGREKFLQEVTDALLSRHFVISISGIGGVGKTALAREVAERALDNGIFDAVIWTSAKVEKLTSTGIEKIFGPPTTTRTIIDTIVDTFDFNLKDESFELKYKMVLKIFNSIKCLLVIDNWETIDDMSLNMFIDEIPEPSKVLITSREMP